MARRDGSDDILSVHLGRGAVQSCRNSFQSVKLDGASGSASGWASSRGVSGAVSGGIGVRLCGIQGRFEWGVAHPLHRIDKEFNLAFAQIQIGL